MNAERLYQKRLNAFFQEILNLPKYHNNSVRLVMAYDAGRVIDLPTVLRHELVDMPEVETNLSFQMS